MLAAADVSIPEVLRYFTALGVEATFLVPTETGLRKSIMDATAQVRDFLRRAGIHDFETQPQGQENKRVVRTRLVTAAGSFDSSTSLYRPVTKAGDPRLWISGLPRHAVPGNVLALIAPSCDELLVVNVSDPGLVPGLAPPSGAPLVARDAPRVDLAQLLAPMLRRQQAAAEELLSKLRSLAGRWHQGIAGHQRHFEVGRLLEELLGLKANSSRSPDFKGIEIKAGRSRALVRQTLFAKVPDWSISPLKSSAEILDAFGYSRNQRYIKQLHCTVSSKGPNTQGLFLVVEREDGRLAEASTLPAVPKVAYWQLEQLQEALATKHPETFWVSASTQMKGGAEWFRYDRVLHTRKPMASALPTLLEIGKVTVDHLIKRDRAGKVSERGPLFKIAKSDLGMLFPPGETHALH
jgi:hypothetical protein